LCIVPQFDRKGNATLQQTSADQYRLKAAQLLIRAARETNPLVQADYELMAQGYLRLADVAEHNIKTEAVLRDARLRQ
jgi:hypothetical protein